MMLKELFQSWFKRHEHKHEEVPMTDNAGYQPIPSPISEHVQPPSERVAVDASAEAAIAPALVGQASANPDTSYSAESVVLTVREGNSDPVVIPCTGDVPVIETPPLPAHLQHDAFAEKLHHLLKLAGVEVDHLWDEAVALAKKLV